MAATDILLLLILGFASGFINTFAGGGSMLTVPFLIFLGLPANMANATNRIAILLQNIVASFTFRQKKILNPQTDSALLLPVSLGCIAGTWLAVDIRTETLQIIIGLLLIFMFFMLLFHPDAWIKSRAKTTKKTNPWIRFLIFFCIGFYGGFIQIGVGFFMLAGLVFGCGFDLLKANAVKIFLILFYTLIAVLIFINYGLIDWTTGLILACGNMTGAWIGSHLSIRWGASYIRYFLLAALVITALKLFGTF